MVSQNIISHDSIQLLSPPSKTAIPDAISVLNKKNATYFESIQTKLYWIDSFIIGIAIATSFNLIKQLYLLFNNYAYLFDAYRILYLAIFVVIFLAVIPFYFKLKNKYLNDLYFKYFKNNNIYMNMDSCFTANTKNFSFHYKTNSGEIYQKYDWTMIKAIEHTNHHIIFILDNNMNCSVLAKETFDDEVQSKQVYQQLLAWWSASLVTQHE